MLSKTINFKQRKEVNERKFMLIVQMNWNIWLVQLVNKETIYKNKVHNVWSKNSRN